MTTRLNSLRPVGWLMLALAGSLMALRLCGADIPWLWVAAPLWLPLALLLAVAVAIGLAALVMAAIHAKYSDLL